MDRKHNKTITHLANTLRKNMTKEEKHLWYDFLKKLPVNVRRQHNIESYIVDFYIAEKKIVIELDGIQHNSEEHSEKDSARDTALSKWGIKVLRYSNKDINSNFTAVAKDILDNLGLGFGDLR